MNVNRKLDELLNAYIDGQLTERQLTELKRLFQHDAAVEARLTQLQKVRALVAALPHEPAPGDITENIKQKLERRSLIASDTEDFDHQQGARQLFYRRLVSAAAIIVLALVLTAVVFVIVGPRPTPKDHIVSENWINQEIPPSQPSRSLAEPAPNADAAPPETAVAVETTETPSVKTLPDRFTARLELTAAPSDALDAFIKRSLVDNGITLIELPMRQTNTGVYNLSCTRFALRSFIADLATIWDKFDSTDLVVAAGESARDVFVPNVTARQIDDIVSEIDLAGSIQLARNIAALNTLTPTLPGAAFARATDVESLPVPKPNLTSPDTTAKQTPADRTETLTFVIQIKPPR